MDFVEKIKALAVESSGWIGIGVGLIFILILGVWLWQGRRIGNTVRWFTAPLSWYAGSRWARQLTVNVIGVLLILWLAQNFSAWVQPTLTPDMLFTPPVIGPQAVKVAMVKEGELADVVSYTGTVKPFEEVTVFARIEGFVKDLKVYPGAHVKKGQVLATLETSELEPRLEHARADENFWKAEYARDKRLYEANAINASQFDRSRMKYQVTQAKVKLIETQIGYATIKALITGLVSERMIYPGVYVKKGTPLLKIERLDWVRIHFDVAEKDLLHFRKGTPVYLRFPQVESGIIRQAFSDYLRNRKAVQLVSLGEVYTPGSEDHNPEGEDRVLRAEVSVVFPAVDSVTRTGIVEVRLPNPGAVFKSNTYVVGDFYRAHAKKAVRVPRSALITLPGGKTVVFVGPAFADQGPAEAREVQVGVRGKRYVQILKGVKSGEYVIYEGNRGLTDGENVMVVRREGGP